MLRKGLEIRGFKELVPDPCVFIKQNGDGFKAVTGDTSISSSDVIKPRGCSSSCNYDVANPQFDRDAVSSTNNLSAASASDLA